MIPDLDGFGLVLDVFQELTGSSGSSWYERFHHSLLHGLPGALLYLTLAITFGTRNPRILGLMMLTYHLHLICDLLGSRGPAASDLWPIDYLAPLSHAWSFTWIHQWPLNAWPNTAPTAGLILWSLWRSLRFGSTPVSLFSPGADEAVVSALRSRWSRITDSGTNR